MKKYAKPRLPNPDKSVSPFRLFQRRANGKPPKTPANRRLEVCGHQEPTAIFVNYCLENLKSGKILVIRTWRRHLDSASPRKSVGHLGTATPTSPDQISSPNRHSAITILVVTIGRMSSQMGYKSKIPGPTWGHVDRQDGATTLQRSG
jgi:hypothetical protein